MKTSRLFFRVSIAVALLTGFACRTNELPEPPGGGVAGWNPGGATPGHASGSGASYGSSSGHPGTGGTGGSVPPPPPSCDDTLKRCDHVFTYSGNGSETSVEVRGDFDNWGAGVAMKASGFSWSATVPLPYNKEVQYKLVLNGSKWITDPANPDTVTSGSNVNSHLASMTCDPWTCATPDVPPVGVFDWRDSVIYFTFVDRFFDADSTNNCNVAGTTQATNYRGGDWKGVTQKLEYLKGLGVNTLWLTVPLKNADTAANPGVTCDNGNCSSDGHTYSAYHGYWPSDPTKTEDCFGTKADLQALVTAAHAKDMKVLFDYAMVHIHTSSPVYQTHKNDGWFTNPCVCGANGCGNYDNTTCWFADYLAHYNYNNQAARDYSVAAAVQLIKDTGVDAYRLDAIKQVDPIWLSAQSGVPGLSLRPQITSQILAAQSPPQRFYMVGETYDFQNRALIRSMIDSKTKLDGQFDFPLRIRLIEVLLMRSTQNNLTPDDTNWSRNAPPGMTGLAQFMDSNDSFYPSDAVMSTFIGNHDIGRSIHYAEDTPLWSNSADNNKSNAWSNQPQVSTNAKAYERLANAFAVILTNKGAPLIYYGDEIGLPGAGDPDNRRMMQWSGLTQHQTNLQTRIAALGKIRADHPATRRGKRTTLWVDTDHWLYKLETPAGDPHPDTLYVAINRSDFDWQATGLPAGVTEILANATGSTIPARQTRIFK